MPFCREVQDRKPGLSVKFAYPLPAGGICLVLNTSADTERALSKWPDFSFGSKQIQPHIPRRLSQTANSTTCRAYISRVPQHIDTENIKDIIPDCIEARRLNFNGKKTETIALTLSAQANITEITCKGLSIDRESYRIVPQRATKIVRCFACQRYGHIAKVCLHEKRCVRCSGPHLDPNCSLPIQCCNCNKKHTASCSSCNEYIRHKNNLTSRVVTAILH